MSVSVAYASKVTSTETPTTGVPAISSADNTVTHSGFDTEETLNAQSPATDCAFLEQVLTASAATIDLTALPHMGRTVDATGKKIQVLKLAAPVGNGNPITVTPGASNGYDAFGASWSVTLQPGQEVLYKGSDSTPDVGAEDKTIDLAGSGDTDLLEVAIVVG